ncbi:protein bride of sevenless [Halyomorpha halys]|uniref:protein bride of sevenless n=1 Tax=Halyomorpha halys TaxID=286706 RepID=UPI0006D4EB15|nr:protein bride of sevenless [Halyomorpha halys]
MFIFVYIMFSSVFLASANVICENQTYVYKQPGNVTIAALIGVHYGEGCSMLRNQGLQVVQSLITAIEAVKINNVVPGLNIGLTVYDTCSQEDMAQKTVISAIVDAECSNSFLFGAVMEKETLSQVKNISTNVGLFNFLLTTDVSERLLSSMLVRVLYDLNWMPVDHVLSENENIANEFVRAASMQNICVKNQHKLDELKKIEPSDIAVIFTQHANLTEIVADLPVNRLLIVPLEGMYQTQIDPRMTSAKILSILLTTAEKPALMNPFNITEKSDQDYISELTKSQASLQQLIIMSDIMKLVGVLKAFLKIHCPEENTWMLCPKLPKIKYQVQSNSLFDNIGSLKINMKLLRFNQEDFEASAVIDLNNFQKLGSVRISEEDWVLDVEVNVTDDMKLCKPKPSNETVGYDCSECSNYNLLYKEYLEQHENLFIMIEIKQEAWVAALLSISSVGVLCSIAIAIFIIVRICKRDMLEGNPGFSFLLLFSIIFMYLSILPFSFQVKSIQYYEGVFCGLKIFGTSLSYALVFSTMLARSVMLASCDEDGGFMSHVNGYLQTVMFFFIAAVQIALTVQFWAINWLLLSEQQCQEMSRGSLFLFLLGYDMLLLLLLLIISPFIMRSKRNYHEGGYFSASALLCLTVWLAWCSGYVFLPGWEEVFICSGLVATATAILVSVFIPRTYLMLTGIVRDHIVSTLPTLAHTASTSVIDVNYRSTQALYDSVTIPRGNGNPNYYSDRPTTPSTSKMEDDGIHENAYERYESSPPPHNITRF